MCAVTPFLLFLLFYSRPEQKQHKDVNNRDTDDSGGRRVPHALSHWYGLFTSPAPTCPGDKQKECKRWIEDQTEENIYLPSHDQGNFCNHTCSHRLVRWTYNNDDAIERTLSVLISDTIADTSFCFQQEYYGALKNFLPWFNVSLQICARSIHQMQKANANIKKGLINNGWFKTATTQTNVMRPKLNLR